MKLWLLTAITSVVLVLCTIWLQPISWEEQVRLSAQVGVLVIVGTAVSVGLWAGRPKPPPGESE